jgi:hypothetical protein
MDHQDEDEEMTMEAEKIPPRYANEAGFLRASTRSPF